MSAIEKLLILYHYDFWYGNIKYNECLVIFVHSRFAERSSRAKKNGKKPSIFFLMLRSVSINELKLAVVFVRQNLSLIITGQLFHECYFNLLCPTAPPIIQLQSHICFPALTGPFPT